MAAAASESGPIAVYGATGYTGRLVAHELRRRGADLVLAGRSAERLERLAAELGGAPPARRAARLDDPVALRELLEHCSAVIACAGPFTLNGEPLVDAAVATGTHYVDTTGEQPFVRMVFERYGDAAERAGCALVPAMGFDYALGDSLASLTAEGLRSPDEITLAYLVRGFRPSRGTTLSALEMLRADEVEWSEGALRPTTGGMGGGTWEFAEPLGRQAVLRYPSGEQITVPRHVDTRSVRVLLSAATALPLPPSVPASLASAALPPLAAATRALLRSPLHGALSSMVGRLPEGPTPGRRERTRFRIECEVRAGAERRRGAAQGSDVYGLTAWLVAEAASRMVRPGFEGRGALAPSQAFGARDLLEAASAVGVQLEAPGAAGTAP